MAKAKARVIMASAKFRDKITQKIVIRISVTFERDAADHPYIMTISDERDQRLQADTVASWEGKTAMIAFLGFIESFSPDYHIVSGFGPLADL